MDLGDKLTLLEQIIYSFASEQLEVNQIPPTVGRLVMEGVYSKFTNDAINQMTARQMISSEESQEEESDQG